MSFKNPKDIIKEARKLEVAGFFLESTRLYGEAIDLLLFLINSTSNNENKEMYIQKLNDLRNYKDELEQRVLPKARRSISIKVPKGSTGFSYERIFGEFLDDSVKEMHIIESYIFSMDQIENLICFLELVVKKCKNLRFIWLLVRDSLPRYSQNEGNQEISNDQENPAVRENVNSIRIDAFNQLTKQLRSRNIFFTYRLDRDAHDRRINLSNGTTFILGHGLSMYQKLNKFSLGHFDYNMRKCKKSHIEILQVQPARINTENLI